MVSKKKKKESLKDTLWSKPNLRVRVNSLCIVCLMTLWDFLCELYINLGFRPIILIHPISVFHVSINCSIWFHEVLQVAEHPSGDGIKHFFTMTTEESYVFLKITKMFWLLKAVTMWWCVLAIKAAPLIPSCRVLRLSVFVGGGLLVTWKEDSPSTRLIPL